MFEFSSIFEVSFLIKSAVLLLILNFIYSQFIKPYLLIEYYRKQGGYGWWNFGGGHFKKNRLDAIVKGDSFHWHKETHNEKPDCKFFVFNAVSKPFLYIINPAMAKDFFHKVDTIYKAAGTVSMFKNMARGSMVLNEGAEWKKGRKVLSGAFHFEFLKDIVPMIAQTTKDRYDSYVKNNELKHIDMAHAFGFITGEITGKFFFGQEFSKYTYEGAPITDGVMKTATDMALINLSFWNLAVGNWFVRLGLFPSHRDLMKRIRGIRELCGQIIRDCKKNGIKEKNLLSVMLDMEKTEDKQGLTEETIVGEFVGLFIAGTDTTANLCSAATYYLAKYPERAKKVLEEAKRELSDLSKVTIESLNRMEYTLAFLKEALRLQGTGAALFIREAQQDVVLGDVKVKKGTLCTVAPTITHYSKHYFTEPNEFIPERWLPDGPYPNDGWKKESFSFLPFSAGPRNCLGQHLALLEAKIIVGLFVLMFEHKLPNDYELKMCLRFGYQPVDPIVCNLTPK